MAFKPLQDLPESTAKGPNGETVKLVWSSKALSRINGVLRKKQEIIDSEVLRLCSPLIPHRSGALERSGTLGTVIGSGEVKYIALYARHQYYNTAQSRSYDPRRGGRWFERMKTANKSQILRLINSK